MIYTNSNYKEDIRGIEKWLINNRACCNKYLIRMIELIGATIVGVKPAELISLSRFDSHCSSICINKYQDCLMCNDDIKMKFLVNNRRKEQVFIYHTKCMDSYLNNKYVLKILKDLGYPKEYSIEKYVDYLIERLSSSTFPHEIGIFLGYPLKDVIGFMGIIPLKLIKTNGWKVYGSERISDNQYNRFLEARNKVKDMVMQFDLSIPA